MADCELKLLGEASKTPITATILALNRSLVRAGLPQVDHRRWKLMQMVSRFAGRFRLQRNLVRLPGRAYMVGLMWANDGRAFPFAYVREIIPYIFDCWPPDYEKWESLLRRNRMRIAFFSARGSAEHFARRIPDLKSCWMPEACDPADYEHERPLKDRDIDVLELGRKLVAYHGLIVESMRQRGRTLMFSEDGTRKLLFPDQDGLRDGLARARISICFPKSMTHPAGSTGPERSSGGLETVTLRYFEGMAAKCVLLGHCPAELEDVFGYNPMIEADMDDPVGQLEAILTSIEDYQELVDRNYARLLEVGTWDARAATMLSMLGELGYAAAGAAHPATCPEH